MTAQPSHLTREEFYERLDAYRSRRNTQPIPATAEERYWALQTALAEHREILRLYNEPAHQRYSQEIGGSEIENAVMDVVLAYMELIGAPLK